MCAGEQCRVQEDSAAQVIAHDAHKEPLMSVQTLGCLSPTQPKHSTTVAERYWQVSHFILSSPSCDLSIMLFYLSE